jgi:hypothetical protein
MFLAGKLFESITGRISKMTMTLCNIFNYSPSANPTSTVDSQLRLWKSHSTFSSVEGKLYREFDWVDLPFFETLIPSPDKTVQHYNQYQNTNYINL